jgi:hypothetical protein
MLKSIFFIALMFFLLKGFYDIIFDIFFGGKK